MGRTELGMAPKLGASWVMLMSFLVLNSGAIQVLGCTAKWCHRVKIASTRIAQHLGEGEVNMINMDPGSQCITSLTIDRTSRPWPSSKLDWLCKVSPLRDWNRSETFLRLFYPLRKWYTSLRVLRIVQHVWTANLSTPDSWFIFLQLQNLVFLQTSARIFIHYPSYHIRF